MHRSWSKRHASPQEQKNPQPQLRRKASFAQRFLGCKSVTAPPPTPEPLLPAVEEKARPRTFYVPTHAAASFARTASPLSPIRIEERDESADGQDDKEDDDDGGHEDRCHAHGTRPSSPACRRSNREGRHTAASNYTLSHSHPTEASHDQADAAFPPPPPPPPPPRKGTGIQSGHDAPSTDYAAFLAQAEVNERAARASARRQESGREWCHSNGGTAARPAAHRDSAYYSTGSRSSLGRGEGEAEAEGVGAGAGAGEDTVAPLPARRQPRTLGRRLSEYFKPPRREDGCLGEMG